MVVVASVVVVASSEGKNSLLAKAGSIPGRVGRGGGGGGMREELCRFWWKKNLWGKDKRREGIILYNNVRGLWFLLCSSCYYIL